MFLTDFHDVTGCFSRVAGWFHHGLRAPEHPFHTMTLATVGINGLPEARTVVMRGFDPDAKEIRFHTDARSPKVAELRAAPAVTLLFYDPHVRLQVRIPAVAVLHHEDNTATAAWGSCAETSRTPYAAHDPPGRILKLDADVPTPIIPSVDDALALSRFVLVACRFSTMDVLELCSTGHRRVAFNWSDHEIKLTRLAP
jgi:hypothetical protein